MTVSPDIDATISRIQRWLRDTDQTNAALAAAAGVDEKTIRQAAGPGWNPTMSTLRKVMAIVPSVWRPGEALPRKAVRRRVA
ncbi:MAG: hypothetical protein WCL04_05065 [Verrucomicrobiota bacterium]